MKKNLFYVFALICSMSLFTACSDDDDETWKEIPTEEIDVASGNATVNINGTTSTTGSVKMTVKNESEATMALKNVIPGYSDLNIDVELQKQADNSFKYAGTAKVNTAPTTREFSSDPAILTVEVDGTITLDGKVTVNVTASGPGLLVGTYAGAQLSLKYSDVELAGKKVYYTVENSVPVLTLANVVPGETTTVISGVYPNNEGAFSGEATTETGTKVAYSGTLTAASGMTLNINITLSETAQGGLAATWPLSLDLYDGNTPVENAALKMKWTEKKPVSSSQFSGRILGDFATGLLSQVIGELLHDVTFAPDGNLTASYYPTIPMGENETFESWMTSHVMKMPAKMNISERNWLSSPKNLAFWYTKESKVYIILNLEMILKAATGDNSVDFNAIMGLINSLATASDEDLMKLIAGLGEMDAIKQLGLDLTTLSPTTVREVLGWLVSGIPLKYDITSGLHIYVDKEMVEPFMPIVFSLFPALQEQLDKDLNEYMESGEMGQLLSLCMMLNIFPVSVIQTSWENNTDGFELGLNFSK